MISAEKNRRAYDIWASTYDVDRPPHSYLEEPHVIRLLNVSPGDTVLDAACGTGRYARIYSELGAQVFGCDLSEGMVQVARAKCPRARFIVTDLNSRLPFEDGFFTKVVSSLAIRHIENLRGFLGEIKRILRPGGTFVFSTIHPEMEWSTYQRSNPPPIDLNEEGVTFPYSPGDLELAIRESGLEMEKKVEILADDSVRPFLTEESFQAQVGKKFVLLFVAH